VENLQAAATGRMLSATEGRFGRNYDAASHGHARPEATGSRA
jgi:hypothetical protein